eukprot:6141400-Ditylum_brightwellii.AAC.1
MLMLSCVVMGCDKVWGVYYNAEVMEVTKENLRVMIEEEEEEEEEEKECQVEFVLGKVHHDDVPIHSGGGGRGRERHSKQGGGRGGQGRSQGGNQTSTQQPPPPPPCSKSEDDDGIPLQSKIVDPVFTNQPFGTKHNAVLGTILSRR